MTRVIGVDFSQWQPDVNWQTLARAGVRFAFIKATQGDYSRDPMLDTHVKNAHAAGMIVGLYHWHDPLVSYQRQAEHFLKSTKGLQYDLLAADVEQQWADWAEWSAMIQRKGSITKFIAPQVISDSARSLLAYWDDRLDQRTVLYTRASFISSYAQPMNTWCRNYPLWLAHYPYATGRIVLSWEEFIAKHLPKISDPDRPAGAAWHFWQFTGDKHILPGVATPIDVNFFNGSYEELQQFAGRQPAPDPQPEPEQPEIPEMSEFDSYPKGVILVNQVVDPAQLGGDFVIAYMGKGVTKHPQFHTYVQAAADAPGSPPLIGLYDNDPLVMIEQYETLNPAKWRAEIRDNRAVKMLGEMIAANGVNRRIHGIIISMDDVYEAPGKVTDDNWVMETAKAVAYGVWTLYGIPVYLAMDPDRCKLMPQGKGTPWPEMLAKLRAYSPQDSNTQAGLMEGIGTTLISNSVPASGTWQAIPAPAESEGFTERLKKARMDSGLGNAPRTSFLWYSAGRVSMPGVTGLVSLSMYMGSRARLHSELQYTPAGENPKPENPKPEDPKPQPGGDYTAVVEAINANTAQLKRIADYLTR